MPRLAKVVFEVACLFRPGLHRFQMGKMAAKPAHRITAFHRLPSFLNSSWMVAMIERCGDVAFADSGGNRIGCRVGREVGGKALVGRSTRARLVG